MVHTRGPETWKGLHTSRAFKNDFQLISLACFHIMLMFNFANVGAAAASSAPPSLPDVLLLS